MTGIAAIGWWVPEARRTAREIAQAYRLSEDALAKLGLKSHAVAGPDDHPSTMGAAATRSALAAAGLRPQDLDLLIFAGITKDWPAPWVAAFGVLHELGATGVAGFDIASRCAAGIDALWLGKALIESGSHRTIAVCCAERFDYLVGPQQPAEIATDAAYAAGAATAILTRDADNEILGLAHFTNPHTHLHAAIGPTLGGSRRPSSTAGVTEGEHLWRRRLTMTDVQTLAEYAADADRHNLAALRRLPGFAEVDFVACSPLEPRPQLKILEELGIGAEKTWLTLPVLGHIGAADSLLSIGFALSSGLNIGRNLVISTRTTMYSNAIALRGKRDGTGIRVAGCGANVAEWAEAR